MSRPSKVFAAGLDGSESPEGTRARPRLRRLRRTSFSRTSAGSRHDRLRRTKQSSGRPQPARSGVVQGSHPRRIR
jgi:hypothetical protein